MTQIRINKFLSSSGICSRRKADEHILAGDVAVNGETIKELGTKIDTSKDKVTFCSQEIKASADNLIYYALYKPRGVISTALDEGGRESVVDLVPKGLRVYPVGRLDKESDGLIILTNDGNFANLLTHPKFEHKKEYFVKAKALSKIEIDTNQAEARLIKGVMVDGKLMKADKVSVKKIRNNRYDLNISIHTGYNRQVRKMCAKINLEVLGLTRTKIGKISLNDLKLEVGGYKRIDKNDIL